MLTFAMLNHDLSLTCKSCECSNIPSIHYLYRLMFCQKICCHRTFWYVRYFRDTCQHMLINKMSSLCWNKKHGQCSVSLKTYLLWNLVVYTEQVISSWICWTFYFLFYLNLNILHIYKIFLWRNFPLSKSNHSNHYSWHTHSVSSVASLLGIHW